MRQKEKQTIKLMEREINQFAKKAFGKNLVSLLVEGSYGTYDYISGYSDYDLLAFVKDIDQAQKIDFSALSKKYSLDIQCNVVAYKDFVNRIKNNNQATRFVGNLELIKLKKQARFLAGRNIIKIIPSEKEIAKRDLNCELQANYYHATSSDPRFNIFIREPKKWANYIINMSNTLLLSQGIVVKKSAIPKTLKKYCPGFKGADPLRQALALRKSKKVLRLTKTQKEEFKKNLILFLEAYKKYAFTKMTNTKLQSTVAITKKNWEAKYKKGWGGGADLIFNDFLKKYQANLGPKILDIGSGEGRHVIKLAKAGFAVVGLELTEAGNVTARKQLETKKLNATLVQGDAHKLPFKNKYFDSVVSIQVFHFNDWAGAKVCFAEATRVLKKNGLFFLRVKSTSAKVPTGNKLIKGETGATYQTTEGNKAHFFTREELTRLAKNNQLNIIAEPLDLTPDKKGSGQWNIIFQKT